MAQPYCYWSVADGRYAAMMKRCVDSARNAGVFKEFHVFTDTPIEGCECYDCQSVAQTNGMYKLVYLKAGMSKLLFDHFVWIDADTLFRRNPWGVLSVLGKSPIHVPLAPFNKIAEPANPGGGEGGVSTSNSGFSDQSGNGLVAAPCYAELLTKAGVFNRPHDCNAAFWIVRRDAIDRVHDLASHFFSVATKEGYKATQDEAIGYAMQMLCADPGKHLRDSHPELWGQCEGGIEQANLAGPAILHLGRQWQSAPDLQKTE